MKKIFFLIGFFQCLMCFSQNTVIIEGKITDNKGEPLPYASIYLKNNKIGTASDELGKYTLRIKNFNGLKKIDTLKVSYIGYKEYLNALYINSNHYVVNPKLIESISILEEVVVSVNQKRIPAEDIIKKTISSIKHNFNQKEVVLSGFYRELIKEDEKWIELNEAAINLDYNNYPQKGFIKKAWREYWDRGATSSYAKTYGDVFRHSQYFPYYTSSFDKAHIISSRVSLNQSKYGKEPAPLGGPMDLVSLDKAKYLYDFLDPKLVKYYIYNLKREEIIDGKSYYVLNFKPRNSYLKSIAHRWDKKFNEAVYVGQIYILKENFSILKFHFQFSTDSNFGIYQRSIFFPDFLSAEVNYQNFNGKQILKNISIKQRKTIDIGAKKASYICRRDLSVLAVKPFDKETDNPSDVLEFTNTSSLREFSTKYDSVFWKNPSIFQYLPEIPKKIKADLEIVATLENQFKERNITVESLTKPRPLKEDHFIQYSSTKLPDSYFWLSNPEDNRTLNYLQSENLYAKNVLQKGDLNYYRKRFYNHYFNFYKADSSKTPLIIDGKEYSWRQKENGEVALFELENNKPTQAIFNYSNAQKDKKNFYLNKYIITKNNFIYSFEQDGDISSTLVFEPITTSNRAYKINNISNFLKINDSTIVYTKRDSTKRSFQLYAHNIISKKDKLLLQEDDKRFDISITKSSSNNYLIVKVGSLNSNDLSLINLNEDKLIVKSIATRKIDTTYEVDHFNKNIFYFNLTTKTGSILYQNMGDEFHKLNKTELYKSNKTIEEFHETNDYLVFSEYHTNGLRLKYYNKNNRIIKEIELADAISSFKIITDNVEDNNNIIIEYESPITTYRKLQIDLETGKVIELKREELSERISTENYEIKKTWAKNDDGIKIPITLLYDKNKVSNKIKGIIIKTYGAYGAKRYPSFNAEDIIYVKEGFIIAFTHIRGGGELGLSWYKSGRELEKINGLEDYITCVKHLTKSYKLKQSQVIGYGLSAGGLVMGYAANNYPNLFNTIIFDRPYLDVINTMTNEQLPLTTMEYEEWGNPNKIEVFNYQLKYSPYQNITQKNYPNMLFYSNFKDVQTPYWQIAKSVAKYRDHSVQNNLILLHTDFNAGHKGSVNYEYKIDRMADQFAFIQYSLQTNKSKE